MTSARPPEMIGSMNVALSFVVHLLGAVLWVGGLLAMSRIMVWQTKQEAALRPSFGQLAGRLNIFALVGMILSLGSGLYQLSLWRAGSFRQAPWMHHKLTMIILLVAVQVLLWRKQKQWLKADAAMSRGMASGLHGAVGLILIGILVIVYLGSPHFLRPAILLQP